jgi:hypothetical protein
MTVGRKVQTEEVDHVAFAVLHDVFQGDLNKWGLVQHIARVAVNAHHEWGDDDGKGEHQPDEGPSVRP